MLELKELYIVKDKLIAMNVFEKHLFVHFRSRMENSIVFE